MSSSHWALLLAGFFSLPVLANVSQENSQQWEFAGTIYQVEGQRPHYTVYAERQVLTSAKQMKALCRKGLALPLRAEYEAKLVGLQLIPKPISNWPVIDISYQLNKLTYSKVSENAVTCSGQITDTGQATNLQTTALSYAIAYYSAQQYSQLKVLLPYLMNDPLVSMDAAGLITLMLSQQDQQKSLAYFEQYVEMGKVRSDTIKLWLAQWQKENGDLAASQQLLTYCKSAACQHLSVQIDDAIAKQDEASADDLSSYF